MAETTSKDTCWDNLENGFAVEIPMIAEPHIFKTMPCGHSGLLIGNKFVCQTCWGWQRLEVVHDTQNR